MMNNLNGQYYLNEIASRYARLDEQSAVLSDDSNIRLAQYLDNEDLLEKLASKLRDIETGVKTNFEDLGIKASDYGFREGDTIDILKKEENGQPKFVVKISNAQEVFEDIDFSNACFILNRAAKGIGTDEDAIAGIVEAMFNIASTKNIEPSKLFKELERTYNEKYDESLKDMLEGEFSGRAEAAVLNAFRLDIEESTLRGLNIGSILADVGLTLVTFGTGTAIAAGSKGAVAAARLTSAASKTKKVVSGTKVGRIAVKAGDKALTGVKGVISRLPGWSKLAGSTKATYLGKQLKVGSKIPYKHGKLGMIDHQVLKISKDGVRLRALGGTKNIFTTKVDDFILNVDPGLANKILNAAKIDATTAGMALAAKKTADLADSAGDIDTGAGFVGKASEVMGWYDTVKADPSSYIESNVKGKGADQLAEMLIMLQDGGGIFGNTTDQEELQIALILTSIDPDLAREVDSKFSKKGEGTVSQLIEDELGGDLAIITKAVWDGMTGERDSSKYASKIKKD
jgi:hypothetical protein